MRWLRRCTLVVAVSAGLAVLAVAIHSFWPAFAGDPLPGQFSAQRVEELQVLVIILLALSGLYTVVFLLSPSLSERILKQQADQTVQAVRDQLSASAGEIRELKEEILQMTLRGPRPMPAPIAMPTAEPGDSLGHGREFMHLSGRLRVLNCELAQIYQTLATLCAPHDESSARGYLNQALCLTADHVAEAELHYRLACLLARKGELNEAVVEIQAAFTNRSKELEQKLARDTEEGGPLYELANRAPHNRVLDELLMDFSIGS